MSFRERIERTREKLNNPVPANDNEPDEGFETAFYRVEGIRNSPPNLVLRFANGSRKGIPYISFQDVDYSPAEGIKIRMPQCSIRITGRDLERLFNYLNLHRVTYIQENISADTTEEGIFIKEIIIEEL